MTFHGLNYFSLLIPLFLFATSILIFILRSKKLVSIEMAWFASAICVSACAQVIQTALLPENIFIIAPFIALLFLVSIILCTHAVYIRLKIPTRWNVLACILIFAVLTVSYVSYKEPNLAARFAIIAISTVAILFNNGFSFIRTQHPHILERLLKLSLGGSIIAVVLRAIILVSIIQQQSHLESLQFVWACSQFLILFFTSLIFILLAACSIRDSMRKLEYERNIDSLTGLLNRRAIFEQISDIKPRTHSQHAVLICDLDHFKQVNDQYGHLIGDFALQHVSHIMRKSVRRYDEVARIGGEEFLILLKDTSQQDALCVAEKIRKSIEITPLNIQEDKIELSISIGVSFFCHSKDFEHAFNAADRQLYAAKNTGRNQIIST